jgi:hypothetical protein
MRAELPLSLSEWLPGPGFYSPRRIEGTFAAHPSLFEREADELTKQGVPAETLKHIRGGYILRTEQNFEFDEHVQLGEPERVILFLVRDIHGQPADIIAWQPGTGWLGTWLSRAWALGQEITYTAARLSEHGALRVHASPLGWLHDECRGIVVLHAGMAARFLCDAGPFLADNVEHGTQLKASLTRPVPRILVRAVGVAA